MVLIKCLMTLKSGGKFHMPSSLLRVDFDDKTLKRLLKIRAIEIIPEKKEEIARKPVISVNPIDELASLNSISRGMAVRMIKAGIKGLSDLKKMTPQQLDSTDVRGIGLRTAKNIINEAMSIE